MSITIIITIYDDDDERTRAFPLSLPSHLLSFTFIFVTCCSFSQPIPITMAMNMRYLLPLYDELR